MQDRPSTGSALPPLLKHLNERTVLDTIRVGAPISRAEISRRAGISKPTVSVALQSLLDAGLVRESAEGPQGPSYGAVFFEPVDDAALVLGLDLGARFLRGAICDLSGAIVARRDVAIEGGGAEQALAAIARLRDELVTAAGLDGDRLDGGVVGVPGVVEPTGGQVRLAANAHGLEGMNVAEVLSDRLSLHVSVENDTNLAALGERWRGVASGVEDFAFLSIGTGLGCGLVLRGELHRGRNGAAGEVDYAAAGSGQELDPSAVGLIELAGSMASGTGSTIEHAQEARPIFAAARAGDTVARAVVAEEARRIALRIAPIAAVCDVALIVLGGGVGANGDLLLDPVREHLAAWLPYPPQVVASSLGDAAVLTGALAVGLRAALENVFDRRSEQGSRA